MLDAPAALLTVATDAVAAVPGAAPVPVTVHEVAAAVTGADLAVRAVETPAARAARRSRPPAWWSAAAAASAAPRGSPRSKSSRRCSAASSASPAW